MKTLLKKLFLTLFSTVVALCLGEILFRVVPLANMELDTDIIWDKQKPDLGEEDKNVRTMIHGQKFREEEIGEEIFEEDITRILFLGDSFTEGAHVKDSHRFSDQLEVLLNEEMIGREPSRKVHIFNAGKGGTSPYFWERYFRFLQPTYKPHTVFAIFFLRDGTDLKTAVHRNKEIIDPIMKKYQSLPLYGTSKMMGYLYNKLAWKEFSTQFKKELVSSYLGSFEEQKAWRVQKAALSRISAQCKKNYIPFHLIIFPLLYNLRDYEFHDVEERIKEFAANQGIPVFSLTPGFEGEDARSLWVSRYDQHPNKKGHSIAAGTLLPYLRKSIGWLDE